MKELKYRTIDTATVNEISEFNKIRENNKHRPKFHITPPFGLLNDPNGFCYFGGEYHLFYQWFPFGTFHGLKHWMHLTSTDLYNWSEQGSKIIPKENYELHGAYSGAAFIENEQAYLFYTGNVKLPNGRDANQCLAILDSQNQVVKHPSNPVISSVPEGYTGHVRDPKIVKHGDHYFMLLGAQREHNLQGCIIAYRSHDLTTWQFIGELSIEVDAPFEQAYMFECPDLLEVDGQDVLIFSPQGLQANGARFNNRYNVVYCLGNMDWSALSFKVSFWDEVDRGFDFYAPQTMANSPSDSTLVGWAGTDEELPTQALGWVNTLTLPRALSIKDNRLVQVPVNQLNGVTKKTAFNIRTNKSQCIKLDSLSFELDINEIKGNVSLELINESGECFTFKVNNQANSLLMSRYEYNHHKDDYEFGNVRTHISPNKTSNVKYICDESIIEVFVENGRDVFTSLFFASESVHYLKISLEDETEVDINLQYLTL